MYSWKSPAKHNIAETCAASISIDEICSFAGVDSRSIFSNNRKLTYGTISGSDELRTNLAAIYNTIIPRKLTKDNFLITNGAIGANFAVLYSLIGRGDHVICQHPTYQQLYSVPESLGADLQLWRTSPEKGWELDLGILKSMIKPRTKMIILK